MDMIGKVIVVVDEKIIYEHLIITCFISDILRENKKAEFESYFLRFEVNFWWKSKKII